MLPLFFLAAALVVLVAALRHGRFLATFFAVLLGVHTLAVAALAPALPVWALLYLQLCVYAHFAKMSFPSLPGIGYRALVGVPACFFAAGTFLALPWAIAAGIGLPPVALFVPYLAAAIGVIHSVVRPRTREIDVALDGTRVEVLSRWRPPPARVARPLRIVQITDPHLGTFMSEARLRATCARAVAAAPDLVLLTGDYLTLESHADGGAALARALAPLRDLPGRVFACRGNHDLEAPDAVARALAAAGALLLIDEAVDVSTAAGPVQILGVDWGSRPARVAALHPRSQPLRLVLLHNPGAFRRLPDGDADLVFSGHTHGGQLGLVALGIPATVLSLFDSMPDHGLWALGANRLYVHRGTGHYGFPLRIGVPAEESVLRVHAVRPAPDPAP